MSRGVGRTSQANEVKATAIRFKGQHAVGHPDKAAAQLIVVGVKGKTQPATVFMAAAAAIKPKSQPLSRAKVKSQPCLTLNPRFSAIATPYF